MKTKTKVRAATAALDAGKRDEAALGFESVVVLPEIIV